MPSLDRETRRLISGARVLGGDVVNVRLGDHELVRLCAVVAVDLDRRDLIGDFPDVRDLDLGYFSTPLEWFTRPTPSSIGIGEIVTELRREINDFPTYFKSLSDLHKHRCKFQLILERQAIPPLETIAPRCLLEFGLKPAEPLASWLVWRKWIYNIDNRSAQQTGYLFEPILAQAIGGHPHSAKTSPIRRVDDQTKGRQVDCLDDENAYEFKLRVTTAASGQGRFGEELSFPRDCQVSGYTPILIVLDPTLSTLLERLVDAFEDHGGRAYLGDAAWEHIESKAGSVMGQFVERYVRVPLTQVEQSHGALLPMHINDEGVAISIRVGTNVFSIPRIGIDLSFGVDDVGEAIHGSE